MIIAIDGPAGAGKSSTARAVAQRLGFLYLDTGAMYRALALAFLEAGEPATDAAGARVLPTAAVGLHPGPDGLRVTLNGKDVTEAIRAQAVGAMASRVSTLAAVREKLVAEQRRLAQAWAAGGGGVVVDGRDIGTVVFPEAPLKIFMEADLAERARRRRADLARTGPPPALSDVQAQIEARDRQDRERALAPLRPAPDAVLLDTTHRSFDEQVAFIVHLAEERRARSDV